MMIVIAVVYALISVPLLAALWVMSISEFSDSIIAGSIFSLLSAVITVAVYLAFVEILNY